MTGGFDAPLDCAFCPRLVDFRTANAKAEPGWFNAPVPSFGDTDPRLLIVGLAPGLKGANRTGRPFTGDYAGDLLYPTLLKFGFAQGEYRADPADGLKLQDAMITNAVRCVPPQNKPTPAEIKTCRVYLKRQIDALQKVEVVVALGRIAHESFVAAMGGKQARFPFSHGARHSLQKSGTTAGKFTLIDSYHCSRYNTNTGRLTVEMFESVFTAARALIDGRRLQE
jgi:uracil-DNA glycosylase family 4